MTSTKIENGVGYAKLDSLSLSIPEINCIRNGSAIDEMTQEITEQGEPIGTLKYKASQLFEIEGVLFNVRLVKPLDNFDKENKNARLFQFPVNAKMLGIEKYDEGITINNFQEIEAKFAKTTGIIFKPNSWAEARFSDVDNAVDKIVEATKWHDELEEIRHRIKPEVWEKYGLMFKTKGLSTGLQLNSRDKEGKRTVNSRFPFIKAYDKALDHSVRVLKGEKWGLDYQPGQRKRYESQIRNGYWKESPELSKIARPTMFCELLSVYSDQNEKMTQYANRVLHEGYITLEAKPKTQRNMSQESPQEFVRNELFQILKDLIDGNTTTAEMTPAQIKNVIKIRAAAAFGRKNGKPSKIAKIVDEMYDVMMPPIDPNQGKLKI